MIKIVRKFINSPNFRRNIVTPNEIVVHMNMTFDVNFKGTMMNVLSQVLYMNQVHHKSYFYKICKEVYTTVPVSIFFPRNSYLVENFNRKLEAFEAAGLIKFWASAHTDMKYLNYYSASTGPKELNLSHISGIVQMLVGGLMLATIVFLLEVFWFKVKKSRVLMWLNENVSINVRSSTCSELK